MKKVEGGKNELKKLKNWVAPQGFYERAAMPVLAREVWFSPKKTLLNLCSGISRNVTIACYFFSAQKTIKKKEV